MNTLRDCGLVPEIARDDLATEREEGLGLCR